MKLLQLPATTTYTVEQALDKAKSENLSDVLILGWDSETEELVVRSSRMDRANALWLAMKGQEWVLGVLDA